eukprot:GAHX01003865.1.p2 GENE.GAHX01003865.1~~GAHX01003865.1.p2  ORF type:complete len:65 (+),score=13.30 GAHX01003865.1:227-421(+)
MGKEENDDTAMLIVGGIAAFCLTGIVITAMVVAAPVTAPVTAKVGVTVAFGGLSGTAFISTQKN